MYKYMGLCVTPMDLRVTPMNLCVTSITACWQGRQEEAPPMSQYRHW